MGQVLLARDTRIGRPVALKLLSPELAEDQDFRARFLREARIAANLEHPNIVPVYDFGELQDCLYIAMRYVPGADLRKRLEHGPLPRDRVVGILSQVAAALDSAHSVGLVHRDVKPGNILLAEPDTDGGLEHVYLADFGLASQPVLSTVHTEAGTMLGTIDYAPPEQLEGRPVDGRADVYALGAVLFESLTGAPPFKRPTPVATIAAQLREPPPRASETRADLPRALDAVLAQALAKSREDRFRTCHALVEAARAAIEGSAAPSEFVPRTVGALPVPLTSFVGREQELRTVREALRSRRLVTLTGTGGAGKTRLANEIALALQAEDTPIVYLDLASWGSRENLAARVRDVLAIQGKSAGADPRTVLVLDDCDRHVDEIRSFLSSLLGQRPDLVVLATGRERLGVPGERTVIVEPLGLPTAGSEARILESPAGRLFWERATAVDPGLEPNAAVLTAVGRICEAFDGLPLGIELAASRVRGLPLEEIADRIVHHPALVADPTVEERRRTISAAIAWSTDLLTPEARVLFRRLGVFSGAFAPDDVRAVCDDGIDPESLIDALAHLVERSLVVMRREAVTSYRLLAPIALFAREQLAESGEEDRVRSRHAARFLAPFVADHVADPALPVRGVREAAAALRWVMGSDPSETIRELAGVAAVTLGDWPAAIALLEPLADDHDARVLEALGVALCKAHSDDPASAEHRRGQQLLGESHERQPSSRTLAALAGTWKGTDDHRAHMLYAAAAELDASNSYALGNLLEYEIREAHSLDGVQQRREQIAAALVRCEQEARSGRNLPWAYFDAGKLLALLGQTMESLDAYLRGLLASTGSHAVESSRSSLEQLVGVAGSATSTALAARLLRLAMAARTGAPFGQLAHRTDVAVSPPVLILAGNSSAQSHDQTAMRSAAIRDALEGFAGTLVAGGTTTGVSALVGELTCGLPDARSIGYVPAVLPPDVAIDVRYSAIRRTDGDRFGPTEPLAYWADLLAAGVPPVRVAVLGIGGGEIAAFEYRLALALGASAGVLRESGREVAELLADPMWSASRRLFEVRADTSGIRGFLRRVGALAA
ncbi:MAG: serine/threonine-protein kinase [Actinomycetota bacterium]|nr:serine/threonine-protein kinase [Actinomycetota bacterium]